jgi:hypothetical protein
MKSKKNLLVLLIFINFSCLRSDNFEIIDNNLRLLIQDFIDVEKEVSLDKGKNIILFFDKTEKNEYEFILINWKPLNCFYEFGDESILQYGAKIIDDINIYLYPLFTKENPFIKFNKRQGDCLTNKKQEVYDFIHRKSYRSYIYRDKKFFLDREFVR